MKTTLITALEKSTKRKIINKWKFTFIAILYEIKTKHNNNALKYNYFSKKTKGVLLLFCFVFSSIKVYTDDSGHTFVLIIL